MAGKNVLSVFCSQKVLGVAFYSANEDAVYAGSRNVMDADTVEAILCQVVGQADPDLVLTPSSGLPPGASLVSVMETVYGRADNPGLFAEGGQGGVRAPHVSVVKAAEYGYDAALHRVSLVRIQGQALVVEAGKTAQLRALGGLLGHLLNNSRQRTQAAPVLATLPAVALEGPAGGDVVLELNGFFIIPLADTMVVDALSLTGLQVFEREAHPSLTGMGVSKEGLSLFGVLDCTVSSPGRRLLKSWFLAPSMNISVLRDRYNAIDLVSFPEHSDVLVELRKAVSKISDVPRLLTSLASVGSVRLAEWRDLLSSALHGVRMLQLTTPLLRYSGTSVFQDAHQDLDVDALSEAAELIRSVIDFDASLAGSLGPGSVTRVVVHSGVSPDLDQVRALYDGLPEFLTRVVHEEMELVPESLVPALTISYVPQLGYMVLIPIDPSATTESSSPPPPPVPGGGMLERGAGARAEMPLSLPGYEFLFSTSSHRYYKNDTTRDLDAKVGDVYSKMLDLEREVFRELRARLLDPESPLVGSLRALAGAAARIDCAIALAVAAEKYRLVRPVVTRNNTLEISGGRHLLQELVVPAFIANDTSLDGEHGRVGILTGPNYSGKSVYLKQAGVITYLAQVGCFVPAESARIGLTDRIFTRLVSRETVTVAESAFAIDLGQIAVMVQHATPQSLLLVDEFGKGTEAVDGIALLGAFINHVASLPPEATPRTLVATHFHELLAHPSLLPPSPSLQFLRMTIHVGSFGGTKGEDEDQVVYLYKVEPGRASGSLAAACAKRAGIEPRVLARAAQWTDALQTSGTPELGRLLTETQAHSRTWSATMDLVEHVLGIGDEVDERGFGELYNVIVAGLSSKADRE